ncbi:hypothetical protein [Pseudomonas purpurea]|uniref:hypothetical protein n=1 Tax=Pseudomonas purpurea TaxID=3136737 RepID=UPI003265F226
MARNRAPVLFSALCYGALEPWGGSQYSARPPETGLKKSPDLIPDQQANLSRRWAVPRQPDITLHRLFADSRSGVFWLFKALAQHLPTARKLTERITFAASN